MVNKPYAVLTTALDKHCPLIPGTLFTGSNPWFNIKLKQERKHVLARYRLYQKNKTNADLKASYTTLVKKYKHKCKRARLEHKCMADIAIHDVQA